MSPTSGCQADDEVHSRARRGAQLHTGPTGRQLACFWIICSFSTRIRTKTSTYKYRPPLQVDNRYPRHASESAEGHQRFRGDVSRPGSASEQSADRQDTGRLGQEVVPVAQTTRQLRHRPH